MPKNLQVSMTVNFDDSTISRSFNSMEQQIRSIGNVAGRTFSEISSKLLSVTKAINSFGSASSSADTKSMTQISSSMSPKMPTLLAAKQRSTSVEQKNDWLSQAKPASLLASGAKWAKNNPDKAAQTLKAAANLFHSVYKSSKNRGDHRQQAGVLTNLGKLVNAFTERPDSVQKVFVTNFPGSTNAPQEVFPQIQPSINEGFGKRRKPRTSTGGKSISSLGTTRNILKHASRGAKVGLKRTWVGALFSGGADAINTATSDLDDKSKEKAYQKIAFSTGGSIIGGALGGAIGSVFGGVGAVPGSMIGSSIGGWLGEMASNFLDDDDSVTNNATTTPIPIKVEVDVKNGNIVAAVNEANKRNAVRN